MTYQIEPRTTFHLPATISDIGLEIDEQPLEFGDNLQRGRDVRLEDGGSTILYRSERNATFKLVDGRRLLVDPASIETEDEIALNLLGPLLRLVLLQRGEFVLHASVVRIGARTAAFIAPSGRGKSTMAAGLYDRGHDVLSDDAGIIRVESGPTVLAGPSVLKLHEENAARLHRGIEPVFPDGLESGKRFYHLTDNESPDTSPLDVIYLLEQADSIELDSTSGRDATMEFVANTWNLPGRDDSAAVQTLQRCSRLADAVAVRCVRYPRSFGAFDDVLGRIEEDCEYER